ncbi:hypothetical protein ACJ73_05189 [Blastomyces percursus]|uniref:Uncharacterized protein n=1 Tax=Blastomyces percursus TaxID=1658174 RepID=A0A1J9Q4M2_9EURO|nr:hypothetical protein ACJ73_05189 [Blastomyces percursus]
MPNAYPGCYLFELLRVDGALYLPSSYTRIRNYEQEETQVAVPSPVQRLASLSVTIYECAANLPSRREERAERPTRFVFEDLFRLTLEFMAVVKRLGSGDVASSSVAYHSWAGMMNRLYLWSSPATLVW